MSKNWTLILASLSLLLSAACAYLALPSPVEALVATEPVKHLGELGQGMTVPVEVELVNRCSETVDIVDVLKSCTCVSAEFSKSSLAPAERTFLKIRWSTRAARGLFGSNIGVVYKRRRQEERHITNLRIEAQVVPDIEYQPLRLVFAPGKKTTQVVNFSPRRDPKATVGRAYTNHRAFTVKLLKETLQMEVSFDPSQWSEENPAMQ